MTWRTRFAALYVIVTAALLGVAHAFERWADELHWHALLVLQQARRGKGERARDLAA